MKTEFVSPGILVAVNDLPDGQLYCVDEFVDKLVVNLSYTTPCSNVKYSAGSMHTSVLQFPTKAQYKHRAKEFSAAGSQS